ncbi:MAG: hypothetical protein J6P58_08740 [Oscillospiraceae bacterium]|nr:hypothetical protein [Oscillospiraceae bacterium]
MKHELEHFYIGDSYGGNQDWFPTFMMRIGGCGAETARDSSVYFALHRGLTKSAPENVEGMTREDYVRFAYKMKPYLSPRRTGIDRLDIYVDGYARYLRDCGETSLGMTSLDGTAPYETARETIVRQIDRGYPVPTLILNHRNKAFRDYVWHWFLINGYDTGNDTFLVKAVTYSKYEWLNLRELWDSGYERRGGFVLYHITEEPES